MCYVSEHTSVVIKVITCDLLEKLSLSSAGCFESCFGWASGSGFNPLMVPVAASSVRIEFDVSAFGAGSSSSSSSSSFLTVDEDVETSFLNNVLANKMVPSSTLRAT